MKGVIDYFKESWLELKKFVTWPTWEELFDTTIVVATATLILTIIIAIMDIASSNLMDIVYSLK